MRFVAVERRPRAGAQEYTIVPVPHDVMAGSSTTLSPSQIITVGTFERTIWAFTVIFTVSRRTIPMASVTAQT